MRRDLIIGILASVLIHGGFAFGGQLLKPKAEKKAVVLDSNTLTIEAMPEMEPEEPEPVDAGENTAEDLQDIVAPPMQADVISVEISTPFTQQLQPPPPPGLNVAKGVVTIPTTRPPTQIGKGMKDLFDIANLDQRPTPTYRIAPIYPHEMRRNGVEGEVVIEFICDVNGNVREPVVKATTHREFESAAIQAVSKWRFKPGKKAGRNVNTRMSVPIAFTLTEN